jgi:hypothetical protein
MLSNNVKPITVVATFFTLTSLAWTAYSVTDLMGAGAWGLLAAVSVDGLWGVVQYLDYKGIGGRTVRWLGWAALAAACGLLAYHGWTINPAAAIAAALPPIVAKAAWIGDIRLRRDPTALTPGQEAEINDVIRDAEYIARMKAAEIERDAAEEIALIQAQAKVTLARDEADFTVGIERLRKRAELERRRPLELPTADRGGFNEPAHRGEATTALEAVEDDFEAITSGPVEAATSGPVEAVTRPGFGFSASPVTEPVAVKSPQVAEADVPSVKPSDVVRLLHAAGIGFEAIADEAVKLYPGVERKLFAQAVRRLKKAGDA